MRGNCPSFGLLILFLLVPFSRGENWPQFRGPRGDGTSLEKDVPTRWSATDNIAWKTPVHGNGHSSPVVWENSVILTTALDDGRRTLLRFDAISGKLLWETTVVKAPRETMHRENSSASSTTATDGQNIITSFQAGNRVDLRCYDFEGKERWATQPLKFSGEHGYSYSPIIYKDLVIFDCRQEGEAATIALDLKTGKIRWRTEPKRQRISHITPLIINDGKREQLLVSGSDETASYDPSSGRQLWWCKGPSDVSVAGMCYGDGVVFTSSGYPDRSRMAIKTDGTGDVTRSGVIWRLRKQASYVPSPVYQGGYVYTVMDEGMLFCLDAKSGESKWDQRLGGRFRSSMILANGLIYVTNDKGMTTVFRATEHSFEQVAANDVREFCYTTPAISNGRIFLRTEENLICIGPKMKL